MPYKVRYAFTSDMEELKKHFIGTNITRSPSHKIHITEHVCFSGYMNNRDRFRTGDAYYTLECNYNMLVQVVKQLNKSKSGVILKIISRRKIGGMVNYTREKLENFQYRKVISPDFDITQDTYYLDNARLRLEKVKSKYPIHRVTVGIYIKSENPVLKCCIEYFIFTVLRTLDKEESYLRRLKVNEFTPENALEELIRISIKPFSDGHSMYDEGLNLKPKHLLEVMDIERNEKYLIKEYCNDMDSISGWRQTDILNRFSTIRKGD